MEEMIVLLNNNLLYIVAGLIALVLLLLIMVIINFNKLRKVQKRYEKFMSKDNLDLEELLVQYTKKLNNLLQNEKDLFTSIKEIERIQELCIQKVGVVRYKAIANAGADLSFTVALLDKQNDGVVLNGIYSRDGSYTYAKPVQNGKSTYTLSEEEEQALQKAIQGKSE